MYACFFPLQTLSNVTHLYLSLSDYLLYDLLDQGNETLFRNAWSMFACFCIHFSLEAMPLAHINHFVNPCIITYRPLFRKTRSMYACFCILFNLEAMPLTYIHHVANSHSITWWSKEQVLYFVISRKIWACLCILFSHEAMPLTYIHHLWDQGAVSMIRNIQSM